MIGILKVFNVQLKPVLCESIQEVVRLEHRRKVVDLDHVAKLLQVETHILISRVVVEDVLDGNSRRVFQMGFDLRNTK